MRPLHPFTVIVSQMDSGAGLPPAPATPSAADCPRQRILDALAGSYCKLKELARAADRSQRQTARIVQVLIYEGLIRHQPRKGYFRPDLPPGA